MPASTVCDPTTKSGAVIQYLDRSDGYKECHVIGRYDKTKDDLSYKLLDEKNPTKGVSMKYPLGEECPGGSFRSATIDVICDNVDYVIDSALEPETCDYHMVMRSYHGCPKVIIFSNNFYHFNSYSFILYFSYRNVQLLNMDYVIHMVIVHLIKYLVKPIVIVMKVILVHHVLIKLNRVVVKAMVYKFKLF